MSRVGDWNRNQRFANVGRVLKITADDVNELITTYGATAEVARGTSGQRVTATRLVGLGIFALAARKRTGTMHIRFLGLNGTVLRSVPVPARQADAAEFWAAEFNRRRLDYWRNRRAAAPGDYIAE